MSNIILAGRSYRYGAKVFQTHLFSHALRITRAVSLNSAIGRGLRKSKGVGFRGKERPQERSNDGAGEVRRPGDSLVRRSADPPSLPKGRLTQDGWRRENAPLRQERGEDSRSSTSTMVLRRGNRNMSESQGLPRADHKYDRRESSSTNSTFRLRRGKMDIAETDKSPKRRSRAGRFNDPNYSFGKRALERRTARASDAEDQGEEWESLRRKLSSDINGGVTEGRRRQTMTPAARRAAESDRTALNKNPGGSKLSNGRQAYLLRVAEPSQWRTSEANNGGPNFESTEAGQGYTRRDRHRPQVDTERDTERGTNGERRPNRDNDDILSTPPRKVNDRIPLSIPYTTPASEFLYGKSVVEAALGSRRKRRRKIYKLYVFKSKYRKSGDDGGAIERLAKENNVPVIYYSESPHLLDKMSGGRPHNGYVLETSPLPKLPLTSLGPVATEGRGGFTVNLDHQSREDAVINGTPNFIRLPRTDKNQPRNPLILFLDSILDPGNLGGIIRTASFLGITAIALSTRNSASLSPIVLKASAGASESVTLFSVRKPASFITESKLAGWKVYAAVAPRAPSTSLRNLPESQSMTPSTTGEIFSDSSTDSNTPAITTAQLVHSQPLSSSPCILMLGSEGEGLRWNLRSKADVELSVAGSVYAQKGGVDSLNVSVAAGILCQAFMTVGMVSGLPRSVSKAFDGAKGGDVEPRAGEKDEVIEDGERDGGDGDKALKETGDLF